MKMDLAYFARSRDSADVVQFGRVVAWLVLVGHCPLPRLLIGCRPFPLLIFVCGVAGFEDNVSHSDFSFLRHCRHAFSGCRVINLLDRNKLSHFLNKKTIMRKCTDLAILPPLVQLVSVSFVAFPEGNELLSSHSVVPTLFLEDFIARDFFMPSQSEFVFTVVGQCHRLALE